MRIVHKTIAVVLVALTLVGGAVAQHHGQGRNSGHDGKHGGGGTSADSQRHASPVDTRQPVTMPSQMVQHMLANMRDHLVAMHEMQAALAAGENDRAATIAEWRLGMSSLQSHGAHEMAAVMPEGMRDAGTAMHRAASRLAVVIQDSAVTGELKPALAALADVTAQCVGCHAGYRLK